MSENNLKVIFLKNVPNVAKADETKEVNDGYARNYLIPKKLAVPAQVDMQQHIDAQKRFLAKEQAAHEAELQSLSKQLQGLSIKLKGKTGAKGQLYGSITNNDIAEAISIAIGNTIDKRKIELNEPIRAIGNFEATVRLSSTITPKIEIIIEAEAKQ